MMYIGEQEIARYRVDLYLTGLTTIHYYGDSLTRAKSVADYVFNKLIDDKVDSTAKVVIFDNIEDKEIQVRYYPDEMV